MLRQARMAYVYVFLITTMLRVVERGRTTRTRRSSVESRQMAYVTALALVLLIPLLQGPAAGTGAISGAVTDSVTARPIAGAIVSLRIQGQPPVSQATDALGRFVFDQLAASKQY